MKVSVSPVKGLNQEITITVPNKDIQPQVDKKLQDTASQVRLPGFRPGKVPLKVVKQRFGLAVRQEVIGEVMNKTYFEAIQKEHLKPAGMPELEIVAGNDGEGLQYKAKFEVMPELEIKGLDKINVERTTAEVVDTDLDNMLETLCKQHVNWKVIKRSAKSEDRVKIDFDGCMDGKPFDGGKAENFELVLGSNSMIPGFEKAIEGMKASDEKTLKVKFPKDYHVKELADKPVEFKVTVKEVCEPELPKLDAEFAKKFNVDSLAKLKKEIRNNMERELEFNLKSKVKNQVMDGLLEHNKTDVPSAMLKTEIDNLRQQAIDRMGANGKKGQKIPDLPDELFKEQASRRVNLGLLMAKVIEDSKMKPDAKRVQAMLEKLASMYEKPEDMIKQYKADQQQMAEIEQVVMEEQVVDKILESANLKEVKKTFSEVMNPQNT